MVMCMFWMIVGSILTALGGLGIYIYYLCKGQFEDNEMVKYQLFREDDPED